MAEQSLAEWLLDRIAEDEAAVRKATPGPWEAFRRGDPRGPFGVAAAYGSPADGEDIVKDATDGTSRHDAEHIARHDPARVLAECEAKRRIVEVYEDERQRMDIYNRDNERGLLTTEGDRRARHSANARWAGLDIAVRLLALLYRDQPGWREEWAL